MNIVVLMVSFAFCIFGFIYVAEAILQEILRIDSKNFVSNKSILSTLITLLTVLPVLLVSYFASLGNKMYFQIPFVVGVQTFIILFVIGILAFRFKFETKIFDTQKSKLFLYMFLCFLLFLFLRKCKVDAFQGFCMFLVYILFFCNSYFLNLKNDGFEKTFENLKQSSIEKYHKIIGFFSQYRGNINFLSLFINLALLFAFSYFIPVITYRIAPVMRISESFLILIAIAISFSVPLVNFYYKLANENDFVPFEKSILNILINILVWPIFISSLFRPLLVSFRSKDFLSWFLILSAFSFLFFSYKNKNLKPVGFVFLLLYFMFFYLSYFNAIGF